MEILAIEVTPKHAKNFYILCWYRPPTSDNDERSFDALDKLISKLDQEGKEIIIIGDTNCDMKKTKDGHSRKLKLFYSKFQFSQKIKEYTRVASKVDGDGKISISKSLIDHFATNRPQNIRSTLVM